MRTGDFSAIPRALRNPFTGEPFPNNQIPTSLFSPVRGEDRQRVAAAAEPGRHRQSADAAVRAAVGRRRSSVARPRRPQLHRQAPDVRAVLGLPRIARRRCSSTATSSAARSAGRGRTRWRRSTTPTCLRPNLLNNLVVTFNRTNNFNFQIYPPDYSTLGINVYNDETPQWFFNVAGYFGINSGDTNTFLRNEIQFVDTVRWTKGRHEVATGIDYSYGQGDTVNNFRANGRFTLSNAGRLHRRRARRLLPRASSRASSRRSASTRTRGCTSWRRSSRTRSA